MTIFKSISCFLKFLLIYHVLQRCCRVVALSHIYTATILQIFAELNPYCSARKSFQIWHFTLYIWWANEHATQVPTLSPTHPMSRAPCHPPFSPGHSDRQFGCTQSERWTQRLSETMFRFCCSLNPGRGRNNVSAFSSCSVLCKQLPFLCRNISLTSFLDSANYCIPGEYITISKYC